MKTIIKVYNKEIEDPRPSYVIMSDDGYFFEDHCVNCVLTTKDPNLAFSWGNNVHAEFELIEYEKLFKKTKKKWRVVSLYEKKSITYIIAEK